MGRSFAAMSLTVAIACSALASGCGAPTPASRATTPQTETGTRGGSAKTANAKTGTVDAKGAAPGATTNGLASYYADSLAGRKTASGEPYDPTELTAAHRTLPFGTVVEVTREDGRSVVVRINDRGPFGNKKRIIDLSRRAAEEVGLIRAGVAPVTVRVVGVRAAR